MTIDGYINAQDWDSAIAACTKMIDGSDTDQDKADAYCHRGYARCFVPAKDDNYKPTIEDLSMALQYIQAHPSEAECYAKRAYAYWLNANYERAMADCEQVIEIDKENPNTVATDIKAFAHELLGSIYAATGCPVKAVDEFKEALRITPLSFGLLEKYREACKKIKDA